MKFWVWCCCGALLLAGGEGAAAPAISRSPRKPQDVLIFQRQWNERRVKFEKSLEELERDCARKNLADGVREIQTMRNGMVAGEVRWTKLPREVQPDVSADLVPDERFWKSQLRHSRQQYARDLYLLSRRTLNAGHISLAYELVREVIRLDSDHQNARRILGFVRLGNEWMSPFESQMLRSRKVWHARFGWISKENVARYEAGERVYQGKWMSAAKEAELHRQFSNAWAIRTEHYLVRTNHSLERGVEIATSMEGFHELFFQMLAGFFNTAEQAKQLFEGSNGKNVNALPVPNEIYYYRTRSEYLASLRQITRQNVEITQGMYFPDKGIAYFYDDPDSDDLSTLFHEGTHQLLSGSRPQVGPIGIRANFWLVEGIACYMESFHREGEKFTVGSPHAHRLQAAQANYLKDRYYVPLRDFARMGMQAFQSSENIRKNYSQCAALTHFFLHTEEGKYRDALIEQLSQIYSPRKITRESPDSLAELTGVEEELLDQEYLAFLKNLGQPERAAAIFPPAMNSPIFSRFPQP